MEKGFKTSVNLELPWLGCSVFSHFLLSQDLQSESVPFITLTYIRRITVQAYHLGKEEA